MADNDITVHEVEYLSVSTGKILERPVAILTLRPEGSFRPHNLAIARSQAERLFEDLKTILSRSTVGLLLVLGFADCSSSVEVEHETRSRPEAEVLTTERTKVEVAVDLFTDQDGRPIDVPLDGTLVVEGCIHFHEHLHINLCEGDRDAERIAVEIVREWSDGGRR